MHAPFPTRLYSLSFHEGPRAGVVTCNEKEAGVHIALTLHETGALTLHYITSIISKRRRGAHIACTKATESSVTVRTCEPPRSARSTCDAVHYDAHS